MWVGSSLNQLTDVERKLSPTMSVCVDVGRLHRDGVTAGASRNVYWLVPSVIKHWGERRLMDDGRSAAKMGAEDWISSIVFFFF